MIEKNTVTESMVINAPYEMISGYAADNANWCTWNPHYSNFHYLSGAGEEGSTYEMNISVAGKVFDIICEVEKIEMTDDELNKKITFVTKDLADPTDTATGYVVRDFKRSPDGTEVILKHHFDGEGEDPVALKFLDLGMMFGLENLKLMMENIPDPTKIEKMQF